MFNLIISLRRSMSAREDISSPAQASVRDYIQPQAEAQLIRDYGSLPKAERLYFVETLRSVRGDKNSRNLISEISQLENDLRTRFTFVPILMSLGLGTQAKEVCGNVTRHSGLRREHDFIDSTVFSAASLGTIREGLEMLGMFYKICGPGPRRARYEEAARKLVEGDPKHFFANLSKRDSPVDAISRRLLIDAPDQSLGLIEEMLNEEPGNRRSMAISYLRGVERSAGQAADLLIGFLEKNVEARDAVTRSDISVAALILAHHLDKNGVKSSQRLLEVAWRLAKTELHEDPDVYNPTECASGHLFSASGALSFAYVRKALLDEQEVTRLAGVSALGGLHDLLFGRDARKDAFSGELSSEQKQLNELLEIMGAMIATDSDEVFRWISNTINYHLRPNPVLARYYLSIVRTAELPRAKDVSSYLFVTSEGRELTIQALVDAINGTTTECFAEASAILSNCGSHSVAMLETIDSEARVESARLQSFVARIIPSSTSEVNGYAVGKLARENYRAADLDEKLLGIIDSDEDTEVVEAALEYLDACGVSKTC